jgi:hypothetical protein
MMAQLSEQKHETKITKFFANPQKTRDVLSATRNDDNASVTCSCTSVTGLISPANAVSSFVSSNRYPE